jgi:hypothetical protein
MDIFSAVPVTTAAANTSNTTHVSQNGGESLSRHASLSYSNSEPGSFEQPVNITGNISNSSLFGTQVLGQNSSFRVPLRGTEAGSGNGTSAIE